MPFDQPTKNTFPFGQKVAWKPDPEWISDSNLTRFMATHRIDSLAELHIRSIREPEWFWNAVLEDLDIEFFEPYSKVLDTSEGIALSKWCLDGRMNIVHNCLDKWQSTETANRTALSWEGEEGIRRTLSYRDLFVETNRCANALRALGLGAGDPVGLFMPMTPELAAAFLAVIKIGGIILPLFSGYGPQAIATRLNDVGVKAVFTSDGFYRRGKPIHLKHTLDRALENCPSVVHVIVHRRIGDSAIPWTRGRDLWWHETVGVQSEEAETEQTSAEDILMIIYTSGTTGRPKGAVHTHCGFPVKAAQDMAHAMDLKPGEMMYWMSDMGWMMGPWLVFGTLINGAGMVFYDGAPDYPDPARLWRIVEQHGVTHLGLSPVLIRVLKVHGKEPLVGTDLSKLRAVGSTGSPWDPESWMWLFENVLDSKKPILNYSGGTEISGGIVCGNFFKPLKPCSFSGPVPGMAADVVNEAGQSVIGEVGELVIRGPWIGMTRGFWKDPDRYMETYWNRFDGVWLHGDFAAVDEDGLWYILGRSDDTIKVAGKRLGPAEVESLLSTHPDVTESAAIGIPHPVKGEELAVFCVLRSGVIGTEDLRSELERLITDELGKPLKPGKIAFTTALPKTRNAKIMRRVIRAIYVDEPLGDISGLENPDTVKAIRNAY